MGQSSSTLGPMTELAASIYLTQLLGGSSPMAVLCKKLQQSATKRECHLLEAAQQFACVHGRCQRNLLRREARIARIPQVSRIILPWTQPSDASDYSRRKQDGTNKKLHATLLSQINTFFERIEAQSLDATGSFQTRKNVTFARNRKRLRWQHGSVCLKQYTVFVYIYIYTCKVVLGDKMRI